MELGAAQKRLTTALKVSGGNETADVRKARQELADIQAQIATMRKELTPDIEKQLREKTVATLRSSLPKLESEVTQARNRDAFLADEIKKYETQLASDGNQVAAFDVDVFKLREEIKKKENLQKQISDDISQIKKSKDAPLELVLQYPTTPTSPRNDKRLKFTLAAGAGVFGLVFLAIAFIEYSARRVYSGEDVRRGLNLPLLGTLPSVSTAARRPLADDAATVPPEQEALLAAVDAIRTTVLHAGQSRSLRVVMVTSAGMGEGKTSLAIQLAASLARSWRRVLLVDGDLRNPSVHQHFNVAGGPGLSEILRGEVHADEAVQATTLNRLSLLPAGRCDRHALEALSQESLGDVFAGFKDLYDFVILDVGPVMPVSDALQFGHHVDGVVLSVLRDVTRLPDLWAARQRLSALNIPILGAVVVGGKPTVYGGVKPAPLRLNG
jgi:capsular exopolysaccharide synthesis family protein